MLNCVKPYKDRQKEENAMTTVISRKPIFKSPIVKRASALALLFALIFLCIIIIRSIPQKDSEFVDNVAGDIEQEMAESRIVLDSRGLRHTAADFREPIILSHGKESRLIVHTVHLSETTSISDEGLWGMAWTSIYQDVVYEGDAQYTVDLPHGLRQPRKAGQGRGDRGHSAAVRSGCGAGRGQADQESFSAPDR